MCSPDTRLTFRFLVSSHVQIDHGRFVQSKVPLQQIEQPSEPVLPHPPTELDINTVEQTPNAMARQCPEIPRSQRSSYEEVLGLSKIIQPRRRPIDCTGARCREGKCPCKCHSQSSLTWRNLIFRFTNPSSFLRPCSHRECKGRNISLSTQLRISNSTIRYALLTSLDVSWTLGNFQISPVLRCKRLVDDKSVSFTIAEDFRNNKLTVQEAALALNQAFDSGEASRMDSTIYVSLPDAIVGGYLLYTRPAVEYLQLLNMTGLCHGLLDCKDFTFLLRYGLLDRDSRFLGTLEELNILYDIGSTALLSYEDYEWHNLHAFSGYQGQRMDPFHLNGIRQCIARCPGFGDIPDGIERILNSQLCPPDQLARPLIVPQKQLWLGLSPLFWAATDYSMLRALVRQGHDPNLTDGLGRTPIFYAAAYGETDCVLQLLEAGAQPDLRGTSYARETFLEYAMANDHPYCVIESLEYLQSTSACSNEVFQTLLDQSLSYACEHPGINQSLLLVESFCRIGADLSAMSDDGDSLGHRLRPVAHAQVLFDHGFGLLNMVGPEGETCLHVAAKRGNVQLVRFYIEKGAQLQERDIYGQNAMHKSHGHLYHWSGHSDSHAWYLTVRTLVEYGVDVLLGDHCRCSCSRNGCSPVKALRRIVWNSDNTYFACILPIEYLMLLEELAGSLPAEQTLAELVRFFLFEELELTHVCCENSGPRLDDEEISEILDEERLLIDQLEEEVEAVLERSLGRNAAEFWEEFLLEFIVNKSRRTNSQDQHEEWECRELTCLECWNKGLSYYSTLINKIYNERLSDESTRNLDDQWLQRRKSVIQRCRNTIKPLLAKTA